jgi:hypothetical protein
MCRPEVSIKHGASQLNSCMTNDDMLDAIYEQANALGFFPKRSSR